MWQKLEAIPRKEPDRPAANTGHTGVKEVGREEVSADTGNIVLAAAKIRMVKGIKRLKPDEKRLPLADFELSLNGHGPILAARIVEGVSANVAILTRNDKVVKIAGLGGKVSGILVETE